MAAWAERAFDAAADLTKQIITLSTGVIALSFTFLTDLASTDSVDSRGYMICSWSLLIASIVAGLVALMAGVGHQGRTATPSAAEAASSPSIYAKNMTLPAMAQIVLFVLGLVLTAVAVSSASAPPIVVEQVG